MWKFAKKLQKWCLKPLKNRALVEKKEKIL